MHVFIQLQRQFWKKFLLKRHVRSIYKGTHVIFIDRVRGTFSNPVRRKTLSGEEIVSRMLDFVSDLIRPSDCCIDIKSCLLVSGYTVHMKGSILSRKLVTT
jgi:hypothetical protein